MSEPAVRPATLADVTEIAMIHVRSWPATLWVLQDNARARRFYSQAGWAADGAAKTDDVDGFPLLEVRYRRPLP
jgi:hypothetical protein